MDRYRCLLTGTRFDKDDYDKYVDVSIAYLDGNDVIIREQVVIDRDEVPAPFSSGHEVTLTMDSENTIMCASSPTADTRGRHTSIALQQFFQSVETALRRKCIEPSYSDMPSVSNS